MKAVVLAGGKGVRLRPLTHTVPKPLIPLDNMPILHLILLQLREAGYRDVTLSLSYKPRLVENYFGDGGWLGLKLNYSLESEPLGTAGPLSLLRPFDNSTLVVNADVLTNIDFADVYAKHRASGALATVALCRHTVELRYGVVEIDDRRRITNYKEKPRVDFLVNGGIYVLEPRSLDYLPTNTYADMPTLLQSVREDGQIVSGYVFEGDWFDIGTPEQLLLAEQAFRMNRRRYLGSNCADRERSGMIQQLRADHGVDLE